LIPKGIPVGHLVIESYRLQQSNDIDELVATAGMDVDSKLEVASFMKEHGVVSHDSIVPTFFENYLSRRKDQTRFSDGTIPVFYTALELDTAREEVKYHCLEYALTVLKSGNKIYYDELICDFSGSIYDFMPHLASMPYLTEDPSPGYASCNLIGAQIAARGIDAVVTPSARNAPGGRCLPIFSQSSVKVAGSAGFCVFTYDNASNSINTSST